MLKNKHRKRKSELLNESSGRWRDNERRAWLAKNRELPEPIENEIKSENILKPKTNQPVKPKSNMLRWMLLILLMTTAGGAWAQGPYPNQGAHTVCITEIAPYGVVSTTGSTYTWSILPLTGGNGIIAPGNSNLTTVTWTSAGTCTLQVVERNVAGCDGTPVQIPITVTPANTMRQAPHSQVCQLV
jgi:hypothetical protein